MAVVYRYRNALGGADIFSVGLDEAVRLGEIPGFTDLAEHLQVGMSSVIFDNPNLDLGNDADNILGLQRLEVEDDAMASGNQRIFNAIIGPRKYRRGTGPRGSLRTGSAGEIDATLLDLNYHLSKRIIPQHDRDAIRPRETVNARMAWILASDYNGTVADNGLVASNTTMMTKADYRGQRASNVIGDCELAAGFGWNAFVYYDEAANEPALFFDNANTSTAYTSTLRLTNSLADADAFTDPSATTFLVGYDTELERDPTNLGSHVYLPFKNGAVYRSRDATVDVYGHKDISAPNANVSKRDRAREMADDYLYQHRNEEDKITCEVELPPTHVNLVKAGHRIQVKFTHLPGYEDWTWCRVVLRTIMQVRPTDDRYTVRLELSPQEPGCSVEPELVQWTYADATDVGTPGQDTIRFSLDADSSIGNLLVLAWLYDSDQMTDPDLPAGWNVALDNFEMQNGTLFNCVVYWKKSAGEDHVDIDFFDITLAGGRGVFMEWSGLAHPTLYAAATTLRQTGLGYASVPATAYPSGALALIDVVFMRTGPEDPDVVTATGTGHSMHIAWDVDWDLTLVNAGIAVGGMTRDQNDTSGTTPLYPAAGGWRFLDTNDEPTVTVGLVFTGDSC